jgi:hypothetical protein
MYRYLDEGLVTTPSSGYVDMRAAERHEDDYECNRNATNQKYIHVAIGNNDALWNAFERNLGRQVDITCVVSGAITAHHLTPIMCEAKKITRVK